MFSTTMIYACVTFLHSRNATDPPKNTKNTTLLSIRAICEYTHLPTKAFK